MSLKAFWLNKYENCGKVLKYFDVFELYRYTFIKNLHYIRVLMKNNYTSSVSGFKCFLSSHNSHAYLTQPSTLVSIGFKFTSDH